MQTTVNINRPKNLDGENSRFCRSNHENGEEGEGREGEGGGEGKVSNAPVSFPKASKKLKVTPTLTAFFALLCHSVSLFRCINLSKMMP